MASFVPLRQSPSHQDNTTPFLPKGSRGPGEIEDDEPQDYEEPVSCGQRTWQWLRSAAQNVKSAAQSIGYGKLAGGVVCIAGFVAAIYYKTQSSFRHDPEESTGLSTLIGSALEGAIVLITPLNPLNYLQQVDKDFGLPVWWAINQAFILADSYKRAALKDGFQVVIIAFGSKLIFSKLLSTIRKTWGGAEFAIAEAFPKGHVRTIIWTKTANYKVEAVKGAAGIALLVASRLVSSGDPYLYAGAFIISSPVGVYSRALFRDLRQKAQLRQDSDQSQVDVINFASRFFYDQWPVFFGVGLGIMSVIDSIILKALLWGGTGAVYWSGTAAEWDKFEKNPIPSAASFSLREEQINPYLERIKYPFRTMYTAGLGYVIFLMSYDTPWPEQLLLLGFIAGIGGKFGLIHLAKNFNPETSSKPMWWLRYYVYRNPMIFPLLFNFIESQMDTGNRAIPQYYDQGDWFKIIASVISWSSFGAAFPNPRPAQNLPLPLLSEAIRFTLKSGLGKIK